MCHSQAISPQTTVALATVNDPLIPASYSVNEKAPIVHQPAYKLQTTSDIAWDSTAPEMKAKLEALSLVSTVDVQRSVIGNGFV